MDNPTYLEPLNKDAALKRCTKCGEWKVLDEFSRKRKDSEDRRSDCKACNKKYYEENAEDILRKKHEQHERNKEGKRDYNRQYRIKNLDRLMEHDREYGRTHREEKKAYNQEYMKTHKEEIKKQKFEKRVKTIQKEMFKHAEGRAKKQGLPFDMIMEDIPVPEVCPILGIPISVGKGKLHVGSPTVDRLIPSLGYVSGNVCVISHRANSIKNNGTVEEHRKIADWMEIRIAEQEARTTHD